MVDVDEHGDVHILVDALEVAHDQVRRHRVQRRHGLVRQDDGGLLVQRPRQGHALLLAAGELVAADVGLVQYADFIQRLKGVQLLRLREKAQQHADEAHVRHHAGQHVLDCRGAGDQVVALKDHADLAAEAAHLPALQGHDVDAVHDQLAAGDVDHAVDGADQGGLARTGQADDGHEFPLVDGQVHILQTLCAVGIDLVHVLEFDQCIPLLCMRSLKTRPAAW